MSSVRFSVIIPTRERADTLRFALRTCLDQTFDDYEIIVSDNCSSPATKAVVDEVASPKVRYVRTAEPVAMSNNWELGVSHARGEFVTVIGDDDGLLPHALTELDRLARSRNAKVIRWTEVYYTWPTMALPGQGNYLRVPLHCMLRELVGDELIREVAAFRVHYAELPMVYNAVIHRDVLADLRQRVGRLFPHHIPDVFSGFAIAHLAGRFLSTSVPMTVSGQSRASNGIATLCAQRKSEIVRAFRTLNAKDGFLLDPMVPDLPVFPEVQVADAFLCARRLVFPNLDATLDRQALTRRCVESVRVAEGDWPTALRVTRDSLADTPELQAWFDAEYAHTPYRPPQPVVLRPGRLGFDGECLHLDAAAFGVGDVAGAALLCEQLLNYRGRAIAYVPEASTSGR